MSQPCFFAHHRATAESTPPDKRTIARSIRLPPSRLGRSLSRCRPRSGGFRPINICPRLAGWRAEKAFRPRGAAEDGRAARGPGVRPRSEEHTSELQSRLHLVCRLLLEKKKT